jgi:uncharacterized protein
VKAADITLVVIAKEPRPGRCKTRLCPPLEPFEAADLALAALTDTLSTVTATPAARRVLALDGEPGPWVPDGFDVVPQVQGGLGDRLAGAFAAAAAPALLVGMDTPQLTVGDLEAASARLADDRCDAVIGPAPDGGYWAIGMRAPRAEAFAGVPMSSRATYLAQRRRLGELGLRTVELEEMRDLDTIDDAVAVAARCPGSRFARRLAAIRCATAA